ncbi:MAG: PD-(D/E)XK nuclease family transposase, partial [Blastocatellia bacterium]
RKTEAELETTFDKWLYVLKHLPRLTDRPAKLQERVFSKLLEAAEIGKFNREEMAQYENSLKHYRDMKNVIDTAAIEGEAKGITKGRNEKAIEVARKALAKNLSLAEIAELTGLSEEEIEALRQ